MGLRSRRARYRSYSRWKAGVWSAMERADSSSMIAGPEFSRPSTAPTRNHLSSAASASERKRRSYLSPSSSSAGSSTRLRYRRSDRIGIRTVRACPLLPLREAAVHRDVQRCQPLLPVEDGRRPAAGRDGCLVRVRVLALVIVGEELVERVRLCRLRCRLPQQEGSNGVPPHEAVDQFGDLARPPDELALDRRHQVLPAMDRLQHLFNTAGRLERHFQSPSNIDNDFESGIPRIGPAGRGVGTAEQQDVVEGEDFPPSALDNPDAPTSTVGRPVTRFRPPMLMTGRPSAG